MQLWTIQESDGDVQIVDSSRSIRFEGSTRDAVLALTRLLAKCDDLKTDLDSVLNALAQRDREGEWVGAIKQEVMAAIDKTAEARLADSDVG